MKNTPIWRVISFGIDAPMMQKAASSIKIAKGKTH
jgi:hypothetical protein